MVGRHLVDLLRASGHDQADVLGDEPDRPVPPRRRAQQPDVAGVEADPDRAGGIAADDGVGGHVGGDHGSRADDRSVADRDAGHDDAVVAEPHVVPDDRVASSRHLRHQVDRAPGPGPAEHRERVRGHAHGGVFGARHEKPRAGRQGAEPTDDQAFGAVVVQHVPFGELLGVFGVVVVGELTDTDPLVGDQRFEEDDARVLPQRMWRGRVGDLHGHPVILLTRSPVTKGRRFTMALGFHERRHRCPWM